MLLPAGTVCMNMVSGTIKSIVNGQTNKMSGNVLRKDKIEMLRRKNAGDPPITPCPSPNN